MRVTCGVRCTDASPGLEDKISALGIPPIVTHVMIRAVYEGADRKLGEKIIALFEQEKNHEICADYDKSELSAKEKHAMRQKGRCSYR